jgi:hypothetical protein
MAVELTGLYDATVQVLKNSSGVIHKCIRDLQHAYEVTKKREAIHQTSIKNLANVSSHSETSNHNSQHFSQGRKTAPTFSGRCFWSQKEGSQVGRLSRKESRSSQGTERSE